MLSENSKVKSLTIVFASAFLAVSGGGLSLAGQMDHASHHNMDHATQPSDHGGKHDSHAHAGHGDHSAHRAAIEAKYSNGQYARSESSYDLDSVDLLRMDEQSVSLAEELNGDSPVLLNFIFTSCTTICPVLSSTFSQFQAQLGDEVKNVKMISISIDPQYDTPEKLREYAKLYKAGPQWKFYTGSYEQSVIAQKAFKAYRGSKMNHVPLTFIKTSADSKWVRLEGFTSAARLLKEFRSLTNS